MIRRNFLTDANAARKFIDGVMILKNPARYPWPGQQGLSIYDAYVFWHHQAMMLLTPPGDNTRNAAHSGPAFLPWHRYYLLRLERLLREALADEDFRIPYWDWAADSQLPSPAASPIWRADNLGRFVGAGWRVRLEGNPRGMNFIRVNRRLRRNVGVRGSLPSPSSSRNAVRNETIYDAEPFSLNTQRGFRRVIEYPLHGPVHNWVGGDMMASHSPNDPVFFLHHCNVDRIWAAWQAEHPNAPYLPGANAPASLRFHRIDDPMYSIFDERITPRQMLAYQTYYRYDRLTDLTAAGAPVA